MASDVRVQIMIEKKTPVYQTEVWPTELLNSVWPLAGYKFIFKLFFIFSLTLTYGTVFVYTVLLGSPHSSSLLFFDGIQSFSLCHIFT